MFSQDTNLYEARFGGADLRGALFDNTILSSAYVWAESGVWHMRPRMLLVFTCVLYCCMHVVKCMSAMMLVGAYMHMYGV